MIPVPPTPEQVEYWTARDGGRELWAGNIGGPEEGPDVTPCPALVLFNDTGTGMVHVAYQLDEIEVAKLAQGGTVWFTTWGMIPVHRCEVVGAGETAGDVRRCRRCGCTDDIACEGGCSWIQPDLCSACVGEGS